MARTTQCSPCVCWCAIQDSNLLVLLGRQPCLTIDINDALLTRLPGPATRIAVGTQH